MSFIWPQALLLLVTIPLLAGAYVLLQQRRAEAVSSLDSTGLVARNVGRRRHLPPSVGLCALALLMLGIARPEMVIDRPRLEGSVILAFDTSNSMRADDIEPTRLDAAKDIARLFVEEQPNSIRVGVVSFGNGGVLLQSPTDSRADIVAAIDRIDTAGATSLGEGIFAALNAVADEPIDLGDASTGEGEDVEIDPSGVQVGYHGSAVIILLTDGENTSGPDPLSLAQVASNAGVRIFPIGIGGREGAVVEVDGFRVATSLDETLLTEIADTTGGSYSYAADREDLVELYSSVDRQLSLRGEEMEITSILGGVSLLLLLLAGALSMRWFGRMP